MGGKKIVLVIAYRDFRDPEYFIPKEYFEKEGVSVVTASNKKGIAIGAEGGEAMVDFLVSQVNPNDYDAILFIGGPGALSALSNEDSFNLARSALGNNKIVGAICIAPLILARAGVLKGKKATVWSSPLDKSPIRELQREGALYEEKGVVRDGYIITASGPKFAEDFAREVMGALK